MLRIACLLLSPLFLANARGELAPEVVESIQACAVVVRDGGRTVGGGVFVSAEGHVVSAAHIGNGHKSTWSIQSRDHGILQADCLGVSLGEDLVLLQAKLPQGVTVAHAPIAKDIPPLTAEVYLCAPPLKQRLLFLTGTIAMRQVTATLFNNHGCYVSGYLINALSPSRCSGGAWFNAKGQVIAIQNGRVNEANNLTSGLAMVATPDAIRNLLDRGEDIPTAKIGGEIESLPNCTAKIVSRFAPSDMGVVVLSTKQGGPLAKATLRFGDCITHVDGQPVHERADLLLKYRATKAGDHLNLTVFRPRENPREVQLKRETN